MEKTTFGSADPISVPELVSQLVSQLGPTIVAAIAGARDRQLPGQWSIDNGMSPEPASLRRLHAAHQIWCAVAAVGGRDIARAWFLGSNPRLNEVPPYLAIRDGEFDEVRSAAGAFIEAHGD